MVGHGARISLPNRESAAEPNIVRLPDGRLFVAIRAGDLPESAAERLVGCWSEDDGQTWTTPTEILADANGRRRSY